MVLSGDGDFVRTFRGLDLHLNAAAALVSLEKTMWIWLSAMLIYPHATGTGAVI